MHNRFRKAMLTMWLMCLALSAKAQADVCGTVDTCGTRMRICEKQWLWGIGRANVLDTYLSPLEYTGKDLCMTLRTERAARWGKGVNVVAEYTVHTAYLHSPTDDGKEWDGEFSAAGGWMRSWKLNTHWRLAAGGLAEASGGFTYNTRGSNNPAQGRFGVQLEATALAEYTFRIGHKQASARVQADAPLIGAQFSPVYGQSYYEIFSLGHSQGVVHFTHPGNVPTARLLAVATLPLWRSHISIGYLADIRQSRLGGLRRHAWRNSLMIGYTRTLHIL